MKKYYVLILTLFLAAPFSLVASAPTPSGSSLQFSMWYTNGLHTSNGTAFPTTLNNCLTVLDIRYVSGGVTPSSPGGRVMVLSNEGNVAMNLSIAIQNLNMPSDLEFSFSWGNYFGASGNNLTVEAGQSITMWFIAEAIAGGSYNSNGQWILNYTWGANFSYSFDIILNATASAGLTAQQIIHVSGNANYPKIGPQPTPTPAAPANPSVSPTSNPSPTSSDVPTPTPSASPSPSPAETAQSTANSTTSPTPTPLQTSTSSQTPNSNLSASPTQFPAGTNITPEFPQAIITVIALIAGTALVVIGKKYGSKIKK
jgi:hypothetical protein